MRKGVVGERDPRKESRAQCVALALHRGAPPAPRQGDMEKGETRGAKATGGGGTLTDGLDLLGVVRGQVRRDGRVESSRFTSVTP